MYSNEAWQDSYQQDTRAPKGHIQQSPSVSGYRSNSSKQHTCRWHGCTSHPRTYCLAKNSTCNNCHKRGHVTAICCLGTPLIAQQGPLGVTSLSAPSMQSDCNVSVNGVSLPFQTHTVADESVISNFSQATLSRADFAFTSLDVPWAWWNTTGSSWGSNTVHRLWG